MRAAAAARGVVLTSTSRPLTPADLETFDHVLAMDWANDRAIEAAAAHWQSQGALGACRARVARMTSFLRDPRLAAAHTAVPDPYYGGRDGFETVLDLLEDACEGLLDAILEERGWGGGA